MSLTILYSYRNRDLIRIKRSLDSLDQQRNKDFNVLFIDYGSEENIASEIKKLLSNYIFAKYIYLYTKYQPWNKCKALNYGINNLNSEYCFNADVDMIFHPDFISIIKRKLSPNKITFFQVGFLSKEESQKNIPFEDYKINFLTNQEATGMAVFPLNRLKAINGFDEFFHFWGSEDTDIQNRLKNDGCEIEYYDSKLLLLHQWHKNYRNRETKKLNYELQLSGIVELNQKHLVYNFENKIINTNLNKWGKTINEQEFETLRRYKTVKELLNEKTNIDHFLFHELPNLEQQIVAVIIIEDQNLYSLRYKIKKLLGKKVPKYYSLKEINDMILLHIISFYHSYPYTYEISNNLKNITFKIKK